MTTQKIRIELLDDKKKPEDFEKYRAEILKQNQETVENFLHSYIFSDDGEFYDGIRQLSINDQDDYRGNVVNDLRHGKGICFYQNKDIYLGDWENDLLSGFGIYIFANGEKFIGNLKNGEKEGDGTYYYLNGNVYEGNWENDKKNG